MSPDEVRAIVEFGPYRSFSNGDLETYKGVYDGREENFQFFFDKDKLWRIGIYLYEGSEIKSAAEKWVALHDSLQLRFGNIETPSNDIPAKANAEQRVKFIDAAIKKVEADGKTQMAPLKQPGDAFVFASFWRHNIQGPVLYQVVLYLNKPR